MIEAVGVLLAALVLFGAAVRVGIILGTRLDRLAERLVGERATDDPAAEAGDRGSEDSEGSVGPATTRSAERAEEGSER